MFFPKSFAFFRFYWFDLIIKFSEYFCGILPQSRQTIIAYTWVKYENRRIGSCK